MSVGCENQELLTQILLDKGLTDRVRIDEEDRLNGTIHLSGSFTDDELQAAIECRKEYINKYDEHLKRK